MNNFQEKKMKRKHILLLGLITSLSLIMAACSGSSNQAASTPSSSSSTSSQGNSGLSQANMLLVGTLKLDGTDQAISAEEAVKLLPLWQAYRSLSSSQTTAEAEVGALINQIQTIMTTEQVQKIKDLNLNDTDMMDLMQSIGGGMGPQGTPNPKSTPGVHFPSGGFPSGNPPSGSAGGPPSASSGGPPSGGGVMIGPGGDAGSAASLGGGPIVQGTQDPSLQATAQARFSTQANKVNTILLDALINKLQTITTQ
jgi:hypothetical protein